MEEEHPPVRQRGPPPPPHGGTHSGDGIDHLSALPDEVLHLILSRLDHHRDAVRTSILSGRWRALMSGLSMARFSIQQIKIKSVRRAIRALGLVLGALGAQRRAFGGLRVLEICVPYGRRIYAKDVSKVLFAAAEVSPVEEFRFILPWNVDPESDSPVVLPGFHRAISVHLDVSYLLVENLAGSFPVLERLTLKGFWLDIYTLVSLCPRLRVLRIISLDRGSIVIQSATLQELHIENAEECYVTENIDITAPALKHLTLSVFTNQNCCSLSISAPMVEQISWECKYSNMAIGIRELWQLTSLSLKTGEGAITNDVDGTCLSLHISAYNTSRANEAEHAFEGEIQNLPVGDLCTLELHLSLGQTGHAWRSIVLHILGIQFIRIATQRLKLVLRRSEVIGWKELAQQIVHAMSLCKFPP
ncbi:F-box/LRR-repeat protein At1g55660 isoform X2 [Triticum aestivum]|uniref:F-box/LRR-repeat protein At1g55660 isoform X2 n=1 Tax=Triticum aestivum TaxID=4565 RepID=UPI001D0213EA|nr:F-box/LRR-repeat protein At1g55660-like isoform X2 [Triticum aestivum]